MAVATPVGRFRGGAIAGNLPSEKIYEDDYIFSFMDINPVAKGHTLVIPKEHYEFVHECPPQLMSALAAKMGAIAKAICSARGADAYNLLCNNGSVAGQVVGHVHFHIIPRMAGDGVFHRWPASKYPQGQMEKIAAEIRERL